MPQHLWPTDPLQWICKLTWANLLTMQSAHMIQMVYEKAPPYASQSVFVCSDVQWLLFPATIIWHCQHHVYFINAGICGTYWQTWYHLKEWWTDACHKPEQAMPTTEFSLAQPSAVPTASSTIYSLKLCTVPTIPPKVAPWEITVTAIYALMSPAHSTFLLPSVPSEPVPATLA